jgi:hypothetical protein
MPVVRFAARGSQQSIIMSDALARCWRKVKKPRRCVLIHISILDHKGATIIERNAVLRHPWS